MRWQFFSRLAFISNCCAASNVAVISARVRSAGIEAEPGSDCSREEVMLFTAGMQAWINAPDSSIDVQKCVHTPSETSTTTTTTNAATTTTVTTTIEVATTTLATTTTTETANTTISTTGTTSEPFTSTTTETFTSNTTTMTAPSTASTTTASSSSTTTTSSQTTTTTVSSETATSTSTTTSSTSSITLSTAIPTSSTVDTTTTEEPTTLSPTIVSTTLAPVTTTTSTEVPISTTTMPTSGTSTLIPLTRTTATELPTTTRTTTTTTETSTSLPVTTTTSVVSTTSVPSTTTSTIGTTTVSTSTSGTTTLIPITTTTTATTSTSTTTSSLTFKPKECPAIPGPLSPSGYTDAERNAYCSLAEGKGSYCKCNQSPPGRVCQSIPGGIGLRCDCSKMCNIQTVRRRLLLSEVQLVDVEIVFSVSTGQEASELLKSLQARSSEFITAASLPVSASVAVIGFQFTPASAKTESAGTVHALLDLTIRAKSSEHLRRLSEVSNIGDAVSQAFKQLIPFPEGTTVSTQMSGSQANVSIEVPQELSETESAVSSFLIADSQGDQQLPSLVSAYAGGVTVAYAPGFIPIVWTSKGPISIESSLNLLPYILAGVGLVLLVLVFLLFKYRMVIKSFLRDLREGRWNSGQSGGWTMGKFAAMFAERDDKSDVSSTPDTATNVDDNEFDDLFLREGPMRPQYFQS